MEARVPRHVLRGISFNSYNSSEILELSVKEITNPQTFDGLLHPTLGGLYDPKLGPTEKDDKCQTCGMGQGGCPGHLGHITLPLPTYNPFFFSVLYQLLKGTCFDCHRLAVHSLKSAVLVQKFRLLEHGLISSVADVDEFATHFTSEYGNDAEEKILEQLNEIVLSKINNTIEQDFHIKNVEACKNNTRRAFIHEHFTVKGKCVHCRTKRMPLRKVQNAKIMLSTVTSSRTKKSTKPKQVKEKKDNDADDDEEDDDGEGEEEDDLESGTQIYLTSADVRDHLRQVWQKDQQVLKCLFHFLSGSSADYPTDSFFIDVVPVPPSRFRPVSSLRDKKFENPQTQTLCNVLKGAALIRKILSLKSTQENGKEITEIEPTAITEIPGKTLNEKLQNALVKLQVVMNCIVDGDSDKLAVDKITGVKQILEKKEGLFRKNMMGKRVNFAARSVISPDPCISTCEIGIPEVFAKKLTFPQPVTPWNVHELRQAVINGPDTYPGASLIDMPDGSKVILNKKEKVQREAIAKQLLTPSPDPHQQNTCKVVHRHLKNGDVLLINRQPTLHRPSIQAHKARVLPGEKTLRLHYANCKAYNADFDGDEMNAHFPQTQLGRAEAYTIACTDYQYLVPKDGTPLAGLIQDHMVSGVSLTIRGRFFTRNDYCQLVYMALVDKRGPINLLPPALIKPKTLWSGKQVLSTLLHNIIPKGRQMLNLTGKSKIPEKSWIHQQVRLASLDNMGESHVVIRGSELLCGVLDKGHYGNTPYGLVHCCYELYGGEVAGTLLSCLGRLFMNFLQQHRSFSLGVEDILVTPKADQRRKKAMHKSGKCGDEVVTQALGLEEGTEGQELREAMMDAQFDRNDRRLRELDLCMKGKTDDTQNAIVGACMPKGLEKLFPANNLQLMVQSGAKGSSVNCMQISGLLGQIELEGRRPPLMLSGKTLPSFLAYDSSPRAGGFVAGRFLTGIRPQEYFFHCMAGREGLIDTAVKTSRSGYLQRCLIKHLEGIIVNYDMTVRDSDGSIVQFYYGEDGLDISKTGFLSPKQFPFLTDNSETGSKGNAFDKKVAKRMKKIKKWNKFNKRRSKRCSAFLEFSKEFAEEHDLDNRTLEKTGRSKGATETIRSWQELEEAQKERYIKHDINAPDPVTGVFRPFQYKGVLPESFLQKIQDFSKNELNKLPTSISEKGFLKLLCDKAESSYCQPGEAVGLLCAQSIGEPSTQMTLNTFHFAGRGEMNVTLGIPRLVEILMVASDKIKTPSMEVPILAHCQDKAKKLQMKFNKVILSEVLEKVTVNEFLSVSNVSKSQRSRNFKLRFHFLKPKFYTDRLDVTPSSILHFMEKTYIKNLLTKIKKKITDFQLAKMVNSGHIRPVLVTHTRPAADEDDADEDLSDMEENDNTASDVKARQKKQEEQEYEEKEEEKEVLEEEENVEMDDNDDEEDEEDKDSEEDDTLTSSVDRETSEHRIQFVVLSSSNIADYKYDIKRELWCEFTLQFGLLNSKIDLTSLIEEHAKETVVHCVPGINRCLLKEVKSQQGPELHICTEGINILEIFLYADILDLNRLYSNDIHAIANMYGIEAANKVIIKEIKNVFAAYGIEVDYRHLSLLADYMTFEGTYKAFNRRAIETCASCLQQMSFETTMSFLVKASLQGAYDNLKSPSSQIVAGKPISCGSGAFELLYKLF